MEEAYEARLKIGGRARAIRIGFCNRKVAGDKDRRRSVVFLGIHPPLVEFAGENTPFFAVTGRMASVIKLPSGQHLRPGDPVPPEYEGFPLVTYNQLVVGPYAAASLAVIAHKDDLTLMAHHGLIRLATRGWSSRHGRSRQWVSVSSLFRPRTSKSGGWGPSSDPGERDRGPRRTPATHWISRYYCSAFQYCIIASPQPAAPTRTRRSAAWTAAERSQNWTPIAERKVT